MWPLRLIRETWRRLPYDGKLLIATLLAIWVGIAVAVSIVGLPLAPKDQARHPYCPPDPKECD